MSPPERSLDLKTYLEGFQQHWTTAQRLAWVEEHPAEAAEHRNQINKGIRDREQRAKERFELNGTRRLTGLDGKTYPDRRYPDRVVVTILEMRRDGYSMRKIAAKVGCSVGSVHHIVKNYVLPD
ncbi:hypothetical protein [Brachybacterium alimentarium]|uniref:hypothetical protein n=1 Tax=Brachybacterium alimentarium TaxID=47845 RepID=UPI003FD1AE55